MVILLVLIGLLFPGTTHAQDLQGETLYDYIHKMVKQSEYVTAIDLPVERFTAGAYYQNPVDTDMEIEQEDIDKALFQDIIALCGDREADRETCKYVQTKLQEIAIKTSWYRQLGKDLQMIAGGYETGISDYPGHGVNIMPRLPSITRIWKSTNETFATPIEGWSAAGLEYPQQNVNTIDSEMQSLVQMLKDLVHWRDDKWDDAEMIAAVWRYKNGVNYIRNTEGNECNSTGGNGELALLKKRWCDIESKLDGIWNLIVQPYIDNGELPPEDYILFPTWVDEKSNIVVWIREDDIGIEWNFPIEPVQPMLYDEAYSYCLEGGESPELCSPGSIIFGGTYSDIVPEPEEDQGICSHPFSKNGYLCRIIEDTECDADIPPGIGSGILLTKCEPEEFNSHISETPSGPDMCEIGGWRSNAVAVKDNVKDTPDIQTGPDAVGDEIFPSECSSCAVDIYCAETCENEDGSLSHVGSTHSRNDDGVVSVCIPSKTESGGLIELMLIHELVHAQQFCNVDPTTAAAMFATKESCCANEREANMTQCNLLAQQGILERAGLSIDECASSLSNLSCDHLAASGENVCTSDNVDPQEVWDRIQGVAQDGVDNGWLNPSLSCEDTVNNLSEQAQAIKSSLPLACTPGCLAEYDNTIGNNLCFTGQCLEQSLEWHRIIPGRMALTSTDEAYPWDACAEEDPQYGKFFSPPALTAPLFPAYNPERLYHELDTALCQINGLPALSPPILCAFISQRRLNLPLTNFIGMGQSLVEQSDEAQIPSAGLRIASSGVGARKANELFFGYLERAIQSFAEILQVSETILDDIGDTEFPSAMCPRTAGEDICSQLRG